MAVRVQNKSQKTALGVTDASLRCCGQVECRGNDCRVEMALTAPTAPAGSLSNMAAVLIAGAVVNYFLIFDSL